ncbi:MAG: metallophosphoesterase family protein [Flavobacteriales bacterium]|nr:metallophosphoesterase family protein [Flavobacteriales bacterium]
MTRIGVIRDTHGWLDPAVFRHFETCDEIWHAGDVGDVAILDELAAFKKLRAVYGNIDGSQVRKIAPEHQQFSCEDVKVWITHIAGRPGTYNSQVKQGLLSFQPHILVCGHSHILLVQMDKVHHCLHLNPGAAGKHGFHQMRTLLRFEIDGKSIQNMQVVELGKRA